MSKLKLSILIGLVLTASACTNRHGDRSGDRPGTSKVVIDARAIAADQTLARSEKAEKLALAAEQLMSGASFMYVTEVANAALVIDPSNKRAQLMKHLAAPAMLTKGLIKRIRPFVAKNKTVQVEYDHMLADVQKERRREMKTFLLDGDQDEDIVTEADAQAHLDRVRDSLTDLRAWLKTNKNMNITLHVPAEYVDRAFRDQKHECDVTPLGDSAWEVECDFTHALELKATAADLEATQAFVAGFELESIFATAYDLSEGMSVSDKHGLDRLMNKKAYVNHLLQTPAFGVLRHDGRALKMVTDMGLDALTGYRWLQRRQDHLCKPGGKKRPGYVFKNGTCVDQDDQKRPGAENDPRYSTVGSLLAAIKTTLEGGIIKVLISDAHGKMDVELKGSVAFTNPVRDLRSVAPTLYDECNQIRGLRDPYAGGVFVNGDANKVLALGYNGCLRTK